MVSIRASAVKGKRAFVLRQCGDLRTYQPHAKWRIRSRIVAISEHVTRRLSPRIAKQEASGHFLESVGSSFTSYAIHLQKDAGERVEDFLQFFDQRRSLFLREPDERAELVKQSVAVGIVFANACNRRAVGLEL